MCAAGGGYSGWPAAAPIEPWRRRYAARGFSSVTAALVASFVAWCRGATLSMIQNPRPMVESTRSCRCTMMSVTGVTGRFCWNDVQVAPLSNDRNIPNSVPA